MASSTQVRNILTRWYTDLQRLSGSRDAPNDAQKKHYLMAALYALAHYGTSEALEGHDVTLPGPPTAFGTNPVTLHSLVQAVRTEPRDDRNQKATLRQFARVFGRTVAQRAQVAGIQWHWATANGRACPKSLRWAAFDFNDLALPLVSEREARFLEELRDEATLNPNELDDAAALTRRKLAPAKTALIEAQAEHQARARTEGP